MQQRQSDKSQNGYASDGSHLGLDQVYWDQLSQKDIVTLSNLTFFEPMGKDCLQFQFLNESLGIDLKRRCMLRQADGDWLKIDDPLLMLATIIYLNNVAEVYPMGRDIVGIKELKEGHFFSGPHELRLSQLIERYGHDLDGFRRAAVRLEGSAMDMADAAFRLLPFPRVPLYYLLWLGDAEFNPRIQVLLDRSIERTLPADAIWALINRVSTALAG